MTPSRYSLLLGAAALAIAGAVAAVNYAVDPYLLFDAKRTPGFNDLKPSVATREWMMKAYQAERAGARTLVIGSSRTDLGLDPATRSWPAASQPVYNMSVIGAGLPDGVKYVRHYLAAHPGQDGPKMLIVGLDFEDALYLPAPSAAEQARMPLTETEQRLAAGRDGGPNPARALRVLQDRAQGLLSLDALIDSAHTVMNNHSASLWNLEPNGHLSEASMRDAARADGFALLFDQKNLDTVRHFARPHKPLTDTPDGPIHGFPVLEQLLALCKAHGIELVLTIQPAHVSRMELLDRMGYWPDYERWKRALATLVAQAGAGQKVTLWDFNGYEQPMREAVPAKGHGDMQWFWDPVHYNSRLGDRIVARIFGTGGAEDLGLVLTPANVDARLAQVREDREAFRSAMPEESARLARLACGDAPCPAPAATVATTLAAAR